MTLTPTGLRFTGLTNFLIINFFTCPDSKSVVYSTSLKKQTAFFSIPNSWQVFVETIYDVPSQLLFDNVNVDGKKYFPYISMIFVFIIIINFSKLHIALDAPSFWQAGFQDPASIWVEGLWALDKHVPFVLGFAVLFVVWFFVCAVCYLVVPDGQTKSKFAHSIKLEFVGLSVLALVFFFPWVILGESWDIPVVRLEEKELPFLEEDLVQSTEQAKCTENPLLCNSPESLNKAVFIELDNLFWSFKAYPVRNVLTILYAVPDSFWSLELSEKREIVLEALQLEDEKKLLREGRMVRAMQVVFVACWVIFLWPSGGG